MMVHKPASQLELKRPVSAQRLHIVTWLVDTDCARIWRDLDVKIWGEIRPLLKKYGISYEDICVCTHRVYQLECGIIHDACTVAGLKPENQAAFYYADGVLQRCVEKTEQGFLREATWKSELVQEHPQQGSMSATSVVRRTSYERKMKLEMLMHNRKRAPAELANYIRI